MKKPIVVVAVLMLLAGCSGGGGGGAYSNPSPSPTPSATSSSTPSPGATGTAPTADQVTWAGNVCSDTTALQTEVQGLAAAAAAGGSQAATSISDQMGQISTSVGTLVDTVKSAPTGTGDDPGYAEVRSTTETVDQSFKTLQASAAEVEGATGVALVTALATVVADTGTLLTDLAATAKAIGTAMKDASSTLGQSFRAAPACASLTSS
ncbi:hypothetical protein [Cryobacterium sp. AP23]